MPRMKILTKASRTFTRVSTIRSILLSRPRTPHLPLHEHKGQHLVLTGSLHSPRQIHLLKREGIHFSALGHLTCWGAVGPPSEIVTPARTRTPSATAGMSRLAKPQA